MKYSLKTIASCAVLAFSFLTATSAFAADMNTPNAMHDLHLGKSGKLKLTAPTTIGDVVLPAGEYKVRDVKSSSGSYVEFSQIVENDANPEGLSVYDEVVVARVNSMVQPSDQTAASTTLMQTPQGSAMARLAIRGEKAVHVF